MATFQVQLYYQVAVMDTTGTSPKDPLVNTPMILMLVEFKGKKFKVGDFTLAELRSLTGTSTAYYTVLAQTTAPNTGNDAYPLVPDLTFDNEEFVTWAKLFPNSILTPFFTEMHRP
tara:strand:- start:3945 stop:4292 length:348 start_codon:yes stop_codon:yes gene_type:complete